MESFTIGVEERPGFVLVTVKGYCNGNAGEEMAQRLDPLLRQGKTRVVIDFSETSVINSPGAASLMDLAMTISDDFKGRVMVSGLDKLKTKILSMIGVIPIAEVVATIDEAASRVTG